MSGKIITIYETREGLGQAIVGVNLAVSMATQLGKRLLVADFDFSGSGETSVLLNFKTDKHLDGLLELISHLDERILKGFIIKHHTGIDVLPGISSEADRRQIDINALPTIIGLARALYPFTIVASESRINARTTALFDASDLILLIISPHLLSLNHAKHFLDKMKSLHYPMGMVKVIVNMSDLKDGIPKKNIETYLGMETFAELPYDPSTILPSINDGAPAVAQSPQAPFSRAIKILSQTIIKEGEKFDADKTGIFSASFAGMSSRQKARQEAEEAKKKQQGESVVGTQTAPSEEQTTRRVEEIKHKLHKRLLDEIDFKSLDASNPELMRKKVLEKIETILAEEGSGGLSREERSEMVQSLLDDVLGLGPLENLLRDTSVSEIMVNGTRDIFIEKNGKIFPSDEKFTSNEQIRTVIDRILAPIGRRVDESTPLVDARLADGSRVNVIIPPLSLIGPVITIRKFTMKKLGMEDLIRIGSASEAMIEFLRIAVNLRKNIVISGGTGSGKTTLLNMLSSFIPSDERIITVEDSAELRLPQRHVITLESKPASIEGTGEIPIRRLVINALRMRPDRIVVGECRGGEALDMLQAMNTGHDGSLTTIHANTPRDAISRLVTMVIMAGTELPEKAIKEQIAGAINIIVQTSRLSDGSRKITQISEVLSLEGTDIKLQDIFVFKQTGIVEGKVRGYFCATGKLPTFMEEMETHGIVCDKSIFVPKEGKA